MIEFVSLFLGFILGIHPVDVPIEPDGRFLLPAVDPEETHFLEAELFFGDGQVVKRELSFGGRFGERVTSALTAVSIPSEPGRPWSVGEVQGSFQHQGREVRVFATRAEEGALLLVRSELVDKALKRLPKTGEKPRSTTAGFEAVLFGVTAISSRPVKRFESTFELRPLGRFDALGFESLLRREPTDFRRVAKRKKEQLWDTLALAGRHAVSSHRPRAVVLLLGAETRDASVLSWTQALHYLERIRVPLLVWAPSVEVLSGLGTGGEDEAFHGAVFYGADGLEELARRAALELASQTLVWLEGEFLPDEIQIL